MNRCSTNTFLWRSECPMEVSWDVLIQLYANELRPWAVLLLGCSAFYHIYCICYSFPTGTQCHKHFSIWFIYLDLKSFKFQIMPLHCSLNTHVGQRHFTFSCSFHELHFPKCHYHVLSWIIIKHLRLLHQYLFWMYTAERDWQDEIERGLPEMCCSLLRHSSTEHSA